jgi:hypothetical protein
MPRLDAFAQLLLSYRGLLTLAPVLVMSAVGIVLLHKRGWRAEALTIAGICLALVAYNSAFAGSLGRIWPGEPPFGGGVPGPRYLLMCLPFLGVALGPAWRRFPGPTMALGVAGATAMLVVTMTEPLIRFDADASIWMQRLGHGRLQATAVTALGVSDGWIAWSPVLAALLAAAVLAVSTTPRMPLSVRQLDVTVAAVCGWAIFVAAGPAALGIDAGGTRPLVTLAIACLVAALAAVSIVAVAQSRHRVHAAAGGKVRAVAVPSVTRAKRH